MFFPDPAHLTPATETLTPILIPPTPTAMATSAHAPLLLPHHLRLKSVTIPGPSHHQITGRAATTAAITPRNLPRAAPAPKGEDTNQGKRREATGPVQPVPCMLMQIKPTTWSWRGSATCSGRKSTRSGARNISAATSATSTSFLLPSSIFLLLHLSGKEAKLTHRPALTLTTDTLLGRTTAPLHRSPQATAARHHRSLQATAAPRRRSHPATLTPPRLTHPITVVPLPRSHPAMDAPHRPRKWLINNRRTVTCLSHSQRTVSRRNGKKGPKTRKM